MRIGIVSDIHEDIIRLREAFSILESHQVDEIICLGDIVGYSVPYYGYLKERNANAVVDLIREKCSSVVVGNHDLYATRKIPEHRSFFPYPTNWYELEFSDREYISRGQIHLYENNELPSLLSRRNLDYLLSLPEYDVKDCGDHKLFLTHYAFPDCTGSATTEVRLVENILEHLDVMAAHDCIYGFSGNDHFEGFQLFTANSVIDFTFGRHAILDGPTWVHGPTVSKGTTNNGVMIYEAEHRRLEAIPLNSPIHVVPLTI